jgi:drug/metabolite transporter (DMT)-like permease
MALVPKSINNVMSVKGKQGTFAASMQGNKTLLAHILLVVVAAIYGFNYTIAKEVMPAWIAPRGFILLRVTGATVLLWAFARTVPRETIQRKDWGLFALCGLLGVAANQVLFFEGLALTTPINASIIMVVSPMLVLVLSALLLKEPLTPLRILGILMGATGAITLTLTRAIGGPSGTDELWGNVLVFLNAASFSTYLVIVRPLMIRYQPITVAKWVFLFGWGWTLPFSAYQLNGVPWESFPEHVWWSIGYVVVFTTFLAYLLNTISLKHVSSTTVSAYIYLQPVIATLVALTLGKDVLTWTMVGSGLLIFAGVYLATFSKR